MLPPKSPPAKSTCSSIYSWYWATSAAPMPISPDRRLSKQSLARWDGIRDLWPADPSSPGRRGADPPKTSRERLYIWEQPGENALASISHHSDPYHRHCEPQQHPLGKATPIVLEAPPAFDETCSLPELTYAGSSTGPGSPSSFYTSSPEPDEEAVSVIATDSGGDFDGGDYDDSDNDPQDLIRHIVAMAAADLRAKASGRSSGSRSSGNSNSSSATTPTTTTDQEASGPFKLRWDAPVFTPMVR
ncbi:hypothetical protein GGTG_06447 [Gaeumannomyces tritici R3-111a-1]|uniref:Uncharacterized protein n=1 Tax=Gaeumannomyces tritici (strain R3-111a-1) TaxID=644352 RepID=J3NYU5_GAET3|nr:hypothetical protein GGTG_06447 [Gaeumannomyces tritici R3-111a-1]EJT76528.1 hypothetical protein GGTG_06447 [Gaeumannomyces tritici R3-111a-1]